MRQSPEKFFRNNLLRIKRFIQGAIKKIQTSLIDPFRIFSKRLFRGDRRFLRRFAVTISGAILGLVAGLGIFGLFLGGIIGILIDDFRTKRSGSRGVDQYFHTGDYSKIGERGAWLAGIVALSGTVILAARNQNRTTETVLPRIERALMTRRIGASLALSTGEIEALEGFADVFFEMPHVDIDSIIRSVVELSDGKRELEAAILLFYRIAPGEGDEITPEQYRYIRSLAGAFNIPTERIDALRESVVPINEEPFRILGVPVDSSTDEIKHVYHRLAAQFHPDAGSELDNEHRRLTEEAFIRIQDAYNAIISERGGKSRTVDPERDF